MKRQQKRWLPDLVISRAKSAGAVGEAWLENLDALVARLEARWQVKVGEALSGGTHALVAPATGKGGEAYVLKIDMPEALGGDFDRGLAALRLVDGRGYAKLYAQDPDNKACLLERLGLPINRLGFPVEEQLRIICGILLKTWAIPAEAADFSGGQQSIAWFRGFLAPRWRALGCPCSARVMALAYRFLREREQAMRPETHVLLHGDAHGGNCLATLDGKGFKLVDPGGLFYEKAYDLGVMMREWVEDYAEGPLQKGRERCALLHSLTGVPARAIWAWGFVESVSTAFVLMGISEEETGIKMLAVAESWAQAEEEREDFQTPQEAALAGCLREKYGLDVWDIRPASRGFYGLTWQAVTDEGTMFLKADPWPQHRQGFLDGLKAVRFLMNHGIDFVPALRSTKDGRLSVPHEGAVLAVFDYLDGEHPEHANVAQQYGRLARVYRLGTAGLQLPREDFRASVLECCKHLRAQDGLPVEALQALDEKAYLLLHVAERLRAFSAVCKDELDGFFLTHGDAGGNCILVNQEPFLVDWDSAMIAPPERDAWINIWNPQALSEIDGILAKEGLAYRLRQERLCYYCYDWFYRYLAEYLEVILYAPGQRQQEALVQGLRDYLENGWIFRQLAAADSMDVPACGDSRSV